MSLRVGIDLTALQPVATGVDNCLLRLVAHLALLDGETCYELFVNRADRHRLPGLPGNFRLHAWGARPRSLRLALQQLVLPAAAAALRLDVLHSPSFFMPLLRGRRPRHALSVYDMTFFSRPRTHSLLRGSAAFRFGVRASIERADLVVVPSAHVRADVLARLPAVSPARVRVVAPGVGEEFHPRAAIGAPAGPPYILCVGTLQPRKDLPTLVDAYRRLVTSEERPEHLVLAGQPGWGMRDLLRRLDAPALRGRVHLAGYVAQADLPRLYAGSRLFVFPSLEEGFGFPPLEAMASGVPTIASDTSAMAENLRGAAELVPPGDAAAWAAAMARLLHDEDARRQLRRRGLERAACFRWEDTARRTLDCYRALARPA